MNASELKEILRLHKLWVENNGGEQADLRGVNLRGMDLNGANLRVANLQNANLEGVNLRGAYLYNANMNRANLREADLEGSYMRGVDLERANLYKANLRGSNLQGAFLHHANLIGVDLSGTNLRGANLQGARIIDANLKGVILDDTNMKYANLMGANLEDASLWSANLEDANLRNANLEGAELRGANLVSAILTGAILTGANMKGANLWNSNLSGANLEGVNLEGVDLSGANLEDTNLGNKTKISHGRRRKARKALEEVKSPIHVQAFRKMFPNAYSVIQQDFSGTMTPEGAKALLDGYGISWIVNYTIWDKDLQRLSPEANDVLRLNVDMNALTSEEQVLKSLVTIREVSYCSMHPIVKSGNLMTIGWVRYSVFEKVVLIEEVQSDLPTVRKGISEEEFKAELESKGINDALLHRSLDVLEPFTQRFYEDAMALVFDMAEEKGLVVEMLTYETKEQFESPKSIYSKLPKAMGMRQTTEVMSPVDVPKVWTIDPTVRANPARKR